MGARPSIAVIGAGVGGLSAAAILSREADVTVFEKAERAGGKIRQISFDGPSGIDSGPTVFTMPWVFEDVFARAGADFEERVEKTPLDVLARHAWPDGTRFDLFADVDASEDEVRQVFGARDAANYLAFCKRTQHIFDTLKVPFLEADAPSFFRLMASRSPVSLLATQPFSTLWSALQQSFRDPKLRQLFGRYATYCGASPFSAPATLMLVAHVEQDGVWTLKGGMQAIVDALEGVARENGAAFELGAEVEQLLVTGNQVQGLRLAGQPFQRFDAVIMNGDVSALAEGFLGAPAEPSVDRPANFARSQSAMTWSMLAEVSGWPLDMHTVCFSDDYEAEFDAVFRHRTMPNPPTVYLCAPDRAPGAPTSDPSGGSERLFCLINAPANGDTHDYTPNEVTIYREMMLAQLKRCGLTVKSLPDACQATTPTDFAQMFPATGGALYGMASHGWRASFQRPGTRSRLKNLYLAGGSAHPGPGVPMAALSGQLAARTLLQDRGATPH